MVRKTSTNRFKFNKQNKTQIIPTASAMQRLHERPSNIAPKDKRNVTEDEDCPDGSYNYEHQKDHKVHSDDR